MAQTLLSDLCSVCHSETPKYRCPRCKTQTCSLPCYKRHQQRAACSGKRDPAAYVKKNDLATPTGVDRDYNYLKNVERTIEDADRLTAERGIGIEASKWRRASSRQPSSRLDRYLERNSITIERAPGGMNRHKTNRTRMTNAGNVHWTVEWVDAYGERRIKDECIESTSIADLYAIVHAEKMKAERRQLEESRWGQAKKRGLKRKHEQSHADSQRKLDGVAIQIEPESLQSLKPDHTSTAEDESALNEETLDDIGSGLAAEAFNEVASDDAKGREDNKRTTASSPPVDISTKPNNEQAPTMETTTSTIPGKTLAPVPNSSAGTQNNPPQHFYLVRPNTASPSRILVPLNPDATLTESLRNRTVQEYPTIYVLLDPPAALGPEFMLESNYLESVVREGRESKATGRTSSSFSENRGSTGVQSALERDGGAPLDAQSILKMLKRDVAL